MSSFQNARAGRLSEDEVVALVERAVDEVIEDDVLCADTCIELENNGINPAIIVEVVRFNNTEEK